MSIAGRHEVVSWNRADIASTKVVALADQVLSLEVQVKELEAEHGSSCDSIIELKEWVGDREVKVAKKD